MHSGGRQNLELPILDLAPCTLGVGTLGVDALGVDKNLGLPILDLAPYTLGVDTLGVDRISGYRCWSWRRTCLPSYPIILKKQYIGPLNVNVV